MMFPANLLTGAKHPAFSTNHATDSLGETKQQQPKEQHKNLNNNITNAQAEANETKVCFRTLFSQNKLGLFRRHMALIGQYIV